MFGKSSSTIIPENKVSVLNLLISVSALFGLTGVLPIVYETYTETSACPDFLGIPACYFVAIGYFWVLISIFFSSLMRKSLFLMGWGTVFVLATSGSIAEVFGKNMCPKTAIGIPKCYFSFLLTIVIFVLYCIQVRASQKIRIPRKDKP